MPRSVNNVAAKQQKVMSAEEANYIEQLKKQLKKHGNIHIEIEK